ncbi:MAG: flavin reductase family protein [Bacilli bacterium]|nr:flavin reductase family protein [Bacilli bacterium]
MRKDLGAKPFLYPQLVMIIGTYDENGHPNAMNAAWGGMADYHKVMVCMSKHKTTDNIDITKEFTISIGDADNVVACDYVGIVSGNDEPNKVEKAGFSVSKAKYVNAPIINELPLCLECRLLEIIDEDLYMAEIVNVNADESILDDQGSVCLEKFTPIIYDPSTHGYYKIEGRVGNAFKDGNNLR